ncbi:response regulator transcription factor [Rapidithrix thailandica]|uniref:Response regulator transcription factor n=1 Tax=Rapidithrix thailandica TaxID=413964 RepID=A0AAW9SHJ9_9BACT
MVKIIIADDHQMFIDGLKSLLVGQEDISVTGEAHNGKEVLSLMEKEEANLVIMDISMPEMDGIDATRLLIKKYPATKVLALSMHNDKHFIANILKAGASGYILKNTGKEELLQAIHQVMKGESYISHEVSQKLVNSFMNKRNQPMDEQVKLSKRELDILQLIADEFTTQEIADKLCISKNTVETHRRNLLFKLNARNSAGLVHISLKKGLIK